MKLVKHIDPRQVTVDNNWFITAHFDGSDTITVSVKTSFTDNGNEVVSTDIQNKFVISELTVTDFSMFALIANINQTSTHQYHESPINHMPTVHNSAIVDVFAYTKDSKLSFDNFVASHSMMPYVALIVPYADCTTDEMTLLVRAPDDINSVVRCTGFGAELPPTDTNSMFGLFPHIKTTTQHLSAEVGQDVEFDIQLVGAFDIPTRRAGVTVYLESTGGILTNQRLVTDSSGRVTGHIRATDSGPFKIKAGFKNFSGILDIYVN